MEQKLTKKQQKELVSFVWKDFKKRREERLPFENQWKLNINFLIGNQYCDVNSNDILKEIDKKYFWEERGVFNHIAPLIETRISKLSSIRPKMVVLPASADEEDVANAKVCKDILDSVSAKLNLGNIISQATYWSEICGTSFYKIVWNTEKGMAVGETEKGEMVYEGDVDVLVCTPFEIYPDSNSCTDFKNVQSLIYAKSYDIDTIEKMWGIKVKGYDVDSYALSSVYGSNAVSMSGFNKVSKTMKHNQAMVIERYERPSKKYPNGRLLIVAEDELVFCGDLPYTNQKDGERGFPFLRQISNFQPSMFWGNSVIERVIPIQRAYNAVKNRKHEFMNKTSLGVLAVEDGSIDIDSLEEEGVSPGKILVYRQGSNIPHMLQTDAVPVSFSEEEEKLLSEFLNISGVSNIFSVSQKRLSEMSGVALQILVEQEQSRIASSSEQIKFVIKELAEQILRLYKQFVTTTRMSRLVGSNGSANFFYWNRGNLSSDEVTFDTEAETNQSIAQKRSMVLELLKQGILNDETGRLSASVKQKVLDMLGFGMWEESLDADALQLQKAKRENLELLLNGVNPEVLEIHDHDLHISSHVSFMLTKDFEKGLKTNPKLKDIMLNHIREHKQYQKLSKEIEQ